MKNERYIHSNKKRYYPNHRRKLQSISINPKFMDRKIQIIWKDNLLRKNIFRHYRE